MFTIYFIDWLSLKRYQRSWKKKMLRLRRVWCQWCQWHCKAWLGGVNDTAESDSSVFFINRGISITFYFINGLKIAWKPWPLHTNELWVQMSKYQGDTLAKLFWNCLFKLEKRTLKIYTELDSAVSMTLRKFCTCEMPWRY